MIAIIKDTKDDYYNKIIDYFEFYGVKYNIYSFYEYENLNVEISFKNAHTNIKIYTENDILDFDSVSVFMVRGGCFNPKRIKFTSEVEFDRSIAERYFEYEKKTLIDYLYYSISQKCFGFANSSNLNKLLQLELAQKNGLDIPNTYVSHSKDNLRKHTQSKKLITKAIQENIAHKDIEKLIYQRVQKVAIDELPKRFFNSNFQEFIEKEIEIRSFYLDGNFYSIGFYADIETIDMRDHYHESVYFRLCLPLEIEQKLKSVFNELRLITGSVDMILGKDARYYFLEINTEGQYGWVSAYGAYNLDYKIANYIINKENEYQSRSKC